MSRISEYQYCPYDGKRLGEKGAVIDDRPACPECGFVDYQNPKACVAILITHDNKILLARRGVEPAKGQWDIPGGFVNADETVENAVIREALEETNLRIRIKEYIGSVPDVYGHRQTPTENLCFLADIIDGQLKAQSDVASLEWFSVDKIPENMAFAHQKQLIQMLKEKLQVKG